MNFILIFQIIRIVFYNNEESFSNFRTYKKTMARMSWPLQKVYPCFITPLLHDVYRDALVPEPLPASPAVHQQAQDQS